MPLYDVACTACEQVEERFVHRAELGIVRSRCCDAPGTVLPPGRPGGSRKTGVFPFTTTHLTGDGQPITVESIGHLRTLERRYGVLATGFSQDSVDTPPDLPEHRPGGREYEGFRFPQYVAKQRADAVRRAIRDLQTGRYRSPVVVR